MSRPTASIVIPVGRVDSFLPHALRSCAAAAGPDDEIVVVLDGVSPDDLDSLAENVRLVVLPVRQGTPVALNRGIAASSGDVIVRLDGDDVMSTDRIERQVTYLAEHPAVAAVCGPAEIVDTTGEIIGRYGDVEGPRSVRQDLIRRNQVIHSSSAYWRWAARELGGYDERCTRMQDYDFFLRMAARHDIVILPECLTQYRVHGKMTSRVTSPYAAYTRRVLRSRRALRRALHPRARSVGIALDIAWWGAQAARYHGVTMPRYVKGIRR